MKSKIKDWYSKEPKSSIWYYTTLTLLVYHYTIKPILWLTLLRVGILAPEVDITATAQKITTDVTESIFDIAFRMFEVGQGLSDSPYRFLIEGFLAFMFPYGIILMFGYIFHGMIRHVVVHIYKEMKKHNAKKANKKK